MDPEQAREMYAVFQSTRPRGARRRCLGLSTFLPSVSIHAPARGATVKLRELEMRHKVSIHAPARGATRRSCACHAPSGCFNPRAREGRDLCGRGNGSARRGFNPRAREGRDRSARHAAHQTQRVSIHAPARGATRLPWRPWVEPSRFNPRAREGRDRGWRWCRRRRTCFNPRAREGRDAVPVALTIKLQPFQSTRPRGARRGRRGSTPGVSGFNPRAREGRDQPAQRGAEVIEHVSIHAPARGATRVHRQLRRGHRFQSTRPRGARLPPT